MRTITRLYDTYAQARQVVADLEQCGIASADINLIANRYICEETARLSQPSAAGPAAGVGAALGATAGLLAGLGIIAIPGLGPVVAAGALASAAAGAAAGAVTGGMFGTMIKAGARDGEADVYCEAVWRGGTMVGARANDDRVQYVEEIMDRHEPVQLGPSEAAYTSNEAGGDAARRPYAR